MVEVRWTDIENNQRFALIGPTSNRPGLWAWLEYKGPGLFDTGTDPTPGNADYGLTPAALGEKFAQVARENALASGWEPPEEASSPP